MRSTNKRVTELFHRLLSLGAEDRARILDEECQGNNALRDEVLGLLQADAECPESLLGSGKGPAAQIRQQHQLLSDSVLSPTPGLQEGALVEGRYRVVRVIGEGGMGVVYEAQQENPLRRVALKVVRPAFATPATLRRFEFEAQALGKLKHPSIAHIYDAGFSGDDQIRSPFLVMEYVEGVHLDEYMKSSKRTIRDCVELLVEICSAVQHAHQKGVIHRDLKPANILVGENGQPKILDFGLARNIDVSLEEAQATMTGQILGTCAYMSPEQISGVPSDVDTRSDVYALGVLLYELLTGRMPHDLEGLTLAQALKKIESEDPIRLADIDVTLKGDMDVLVAKALEKDKSRRYQTVAELAQDLRRYLADLPIMARPPSTLYILEKLARKHRPWVIGFSATLVAIMIGLGTALTLWKQEKEQRKLAEAATEAATLERRKADDAREDAMLSQDRAERAKERADSTLSFLQDLFGSANPRNLGFDVRISEVMEDASLALETSEVKDPLVAARIRYCLASVQKSIGDYRSALNNASLAADARTRALGPRAPKTMEAELLVGQIESAMSRYVASDQRLDALIQKYGEMGMTGCGSYLLVRLTQAVNLKSLRHFDRAEALRAPLLEPIEREFGANSGVAHEARTLLSRLYFDLGDERKSQELAKENFASSCAVYGEDHPETVLARINMIQSLSHDVPLEDTIDQLDDAIADLQDTFGPDHPKALQARIDMATFFDEMENVEVSVLLLEDTLEHASHTFGARSRQTFIVQVGLALDLVKVGRSEEGLALMLETIKAIKEALGSSDAILASAYHNLGMIHLKMEGDRATRHGNADTPEARAKLQSSAEAFEKAVALARTIYEPPHRDLGMYLVNLGTVLGFMRHNDRAYEVLLEGSQMLEDSLGHDHARTKRTKSVLRKFEREALKGPSPSRDLDGD